MHCLGPVGCQRSSLCQALFCCRNRSIATSQGLCSPKWAARSERRTTRPRLSALGLSPYHHRRLSFEPLEDRRLLSIFYVSPTGNDTNSGAIDAPWKTARFADYAVELGIVHPGDTVCFRAGDYKFLQEPLDPATGLTADFGALWFWGKQIYPTQTPFPTWGGTAGNPITFAAYPGEHVEFDSCLQLQWTQDGAKDWHVSLDGTAALDPFIQYKATVSGTLSPNAAGNYAPTYPHNGKQAFWLVPGGPGKYANLLCFLR